MLKKIKITPSQTVVFIVGLLLLTAVYGASMANTFSIHGHQPHSNHHDFMNHEGHQNHSNHAMHGVYNGVHIPNDEELAKWGFDEAMIADLHELESKYENESQELGEKIKLAEEKWLQIKADDSAKEKSLHSAIDDFFAAKARLMKLQASIAVESREIMGDDFFSKIHESHKQ